MPAPSSSPTVLLDAVTEAGLPPGRLDAAESISLLQALAAVPEPRKARGRRHGLRSVLLLAVGAVLAGARSYAVIAQWARCAEQAAAVCGPTPHASTIDDLATMCREDIMPLIQGMDGCVGLSMLADRETGRCIVTTAWEGEARQRPGRPGVPEPCRAARRW